MNFSLKAAATILLASFASSIYGQSKLNSSKSELKSERSSGRQSYSSSHRHGSYRDESFDPFFFEAFMFVTYYSMVGNYAAEEHLGNDLTPYPYFNGIAGNYLTLDEYTAPPKPVRIDVDNKFMIGDDNVLGNRLNISLRPFKYAYLQADYLQLAEVYSNSSELSRLSVFNFDFCYDRLRFSQFNLGWTIGVTYVANDVNRAGFTFGLNASAFLGGNFSLNGVTRWSIINACNVNQFDVNLKYHFGWFYTSIGYENLKIASPSYNFLTVGFGLYL